MKALEFSLSYDLESFDVQRQIGDDPFEPAILVFERAHLSDTAEALSIMASLFFRICGSLIFINNR